MGVNPHFVLVHGAWHGAWCWSRVLSLLRISGYSAHAVTLSGLGERVHLLSNSINLRTHIEDVLNLIRAEELNHIVLVGHSYAGGVITAVAHELLQETRQEARVTIRQLVYLDALVPRSGESWSSTHTQEVMERRVAAAREYGARHGVEAIPPPDARIFGLSGDDLAWVNRRQTPQPLGVYLDVCTFDEAKLGSVGRTFIDCTRPALSTIDVARARVRADRSWRVLTLETGHDAMISEPEKLTRMLLGSYL